MLKTQMIIFALAATAFGASTSTKAVDRVGEAKTVLEEIMSAGDKGIPKDLLEKAHCVAIVPALKKGGFLVGAEYGKGVLMCKQADNSWVGPATIRVEGGSFGLQIGAGEVDLVLLVMNESGAKKMVSSEFKIGASAGVMAGPVGRSVDAATDVLLRAEILGYSRSRGAFAGVALEGSTIRESKDDNEAIFGSRLTNEEILFGSTPRLADAARPLARLLRHDSEKDNK